MVSLFMRPERTAGFADFRDLAAAHVTRIIQNWRGRDGNDPSVDIAKDADQRF